MRNHRNIFWVLAGIFFLMLFWTTKSDPFFGDSISSISRASNHIYRTNFKEIQYPNNLDPGHPLTYPLAHATLWKIIGRSLWVSHLFHGLFGLATLLLLIKWAKREGYHREAYIIGALLFLTPLFVSQTVNPNMHLPMTCFALGLGYCLRFDKKWGQMAFSLLLVITHLQGLYYLGPIWLWWFLMTSDKTYTQKIAHGFKMLLLPALAFVGWLWYHYHLTGWTLSSPDYAGHRGFPGIKRFVVNLIMADWRMIDYGQIALFILPLGALIRGKVNWNWKNPMALFLILFLFNAFALAATTKTGPMHRYLLPCLPFILLANLQYLKTIKIPKLGLIFLILISGHFWFYPGKVMGDATLSYRSIFPLLETAKEEFDQEAFHTYAPLSNPSEDTRLCCSANDYIPLYNVDLDSAKYVIRSNISGDFKTSELERLDSIWPVKTYQKGYVYLEVYNNPTLVLEPKSGPRRTIGRLEKWMIWLKHKIKGKDSV